MTFRRPITMAPEQGADGGSAAGGSPAPAVAAPAAAEAKADPAAAPAPDLRARLADAKEKRQSQMNELQKALEAQNDTIAALKKQLEDMAAAREADKVAAAGSAKKATLLGALSDAKVLPAYRDFAVSKLEGLDLAQEGWQAKVDEFTKKHPEIVERQPRPAVQSDWAKTTAQALGERAGRTLLGSMSAEQVASLHGRRNA